MKRNSIKKLWSPSSKIDGNNDIRITWDECFNYNYKADQASGFATWELDDFPVGPIDEFNHEILEQTIDQFTKRS